MARGPRIHARAVIAVATFAAALAACNLIAGLTEDYTVGGRDGSAGGGDGSDDAAGNSEGGADAAKDGLSSDAPQDAPKDSPTGSFCEVAAAEPFAFCCDFESTACVWDQIGTAGGTIVVEQNVGVGGSKGLHAALKDPSATGGKVFYRKLLGEPFSYFHKHVLSFKFRVSKPCTLYGTWVGAFGFTNASANLESFGTEVFLKPGPTNAIGLGDPPGTSTAASHPVGMATDWHVASITMDRSADSGPYSSTILVDGTTIDSARPFDGGAQTAELLVGTFFSGPGPGEVDVIIDDVVVRQVR